MFKFLTKTFFVVTIWRQYKRIIISSIVLILGYIVTSTIHDDYVSYAVNANSTNNLFASYVIKWIVLMAITVGYYFYNSVNRRGLIDAKPSNGNDAIQAPNQPNNDMPDPFSGIREKETLKGRVDSTRDL